MKSINKITVLFLIIASVLSCQETKKSTHAIDVKYFGALKTIMSGNIQSAIALDSLSNQKNFYALGAVENLKGEIQIFNSKPSNSSVLDGSLSISDTYDINASLLVYANVDVWVDYQIDSKLTKSELESLILNKAKENKINIDKPFPFLIEGNIASLDWHVIDWKEGDTIHNHKKHKESGLNDVLNDTEVEIIGFYSTKHKAIFTHHTTNMHMHFKTDDNMVAGHIDDLFINNAVTLKLPKQ
ncbi:acetolactate decarboxylase [Winogradskyella sp. HB-48]|uniref:acetolactate decarboxylase n=1 Tax=Winogradskyella sp. HB-48 TaxID=3416808 RepID=UPI003CFA295B